MKRKIISILIAGCLTGCVGMQNNVNNLKVRVATLETMIQSQNRIIKQLQKEINQLKKLQKLQGSQNLQNTYSEILSLKTQLLAEMEDLKNQQNTFASELDDLKFNQEQINNELKKEVSNLNTKIELLKLEIEGLKKLVNQISQQAKQNQQITQYPNTLYSNKIQGNATNYGKGNLTSTSNQTSLTATNATQNQVTNTSKVVKNTSNTGNFTGSLPSNQTISTSNATKTSVNVSNQTISVKIKPKNENTPKKQTVESNLKNLSEAELYEKAYNYYKNHQFEKALKTFKVYLQRFPQGKWIGQAYFWIGECYFHLKDYENAILNYEKLIELPQFHPLKPAALFRQAMAFKALGDDQVYQIILKKLIQTYPYSKEAMKAKKLLNEK